MRNLRSHSARREPRANCRKTKPSSGHDHAASIRNSFDLAARLVGGGRTVHPVWRVFRSVFHGFTRYRCLAPSTRFRVVSWPVQIRANNLRFFCLIKHKNVPVAGELLFHQPQGLQHCYMRPAGAAMGQTTFSVGAALSVPDQPCIGLPTNPAQMTTAARFCGLVAAYQTASGAENDSATSTNRSN